MKPEKIIELRVDRFELPDGQEDTVKSLLEEIKKIIDADLEEVGPGKGNPDPILVFGARRFSKRC